MRFSPLRRRSRGYQGFSFLAVAWVGTSFQPTVAQEAPGSRGSSWGTEAWPGERWEYARPADREGWSPQGLEEADSLAQSIGTAAYVVVQEGRIVHEWGETDRRYNIHSVRKSLLGILIGIAQSAGELDTAATLADLDIDDVDGLTPAERRATVADLLRSRSGVYHPAAYETPGMMNNRPGRGSRAPGEVFFYNNWDFNALATIYEQETGSDLFVAFEREWHEAY